MLRRIKYLFLSLLVFCCVTSRADTNTVDYSGVLNTISTDLSDIESVMSKIESDLFEALDYISSIEQSLGSSVGFTLSGMRVHLSNIYTVLYSVYTSLHTIKNNWTTAITDLDTLVSVLSTMEYNLHSVPSDTSLILKDTSFLSRTVVDIYDHLSDLSDASSSLAQIKDQIQSILDNGELNKEDTQQAILNVLTGMTDTADSIKEALDIMQEEGGISDITSAIGSLKDVVQNIQRLFNTWDLGFFRYLYDRTFPSYSLDFWRVRDSPFFSSGYVTYNTQLGTTSPYSFVDWLTQSLSAHNQGLQVVNDNLLFIAHYISSNTTDSATSQFESDSQNIIDEAQSYYDQISQALNYEGLTFDTSLLQLGRIKDVINSYYSPGYDRIKSHAVSIQEFNRIDSDLPSYFDFQYDLTPISDFIEQVRVFFSVVWMLLFASLFLWLCFWFRKFYNWLFVQVCGNAPNQSPISPMPI